MNIPPYNRYNDVELDNDLLRRTLQGGLSDNGWTLPQQSTANIESISSQMPDGTMWYDTGSNSFKVKIDGLVKTVTVS